MPITLAQLEAFVSSDHYDSATAGLIAQRIPALPRLKGEQIAPGITRIHGNLCNVHGKYGPCDKALSGKKKPGKGRKPAKPKQTDAQRSAERDAKRQQNTADVKKQMADNDTGLSPGGVDALVAFASGKQPTPEQGAGLAQMGLAEQASDGSYRMTPTGRAAVSAMAAGDYQRTVDTISRAHDAQGKRTERQTAQQTRQEAARQRRADVAARRQAAAAERARRQAEQAKKPAKAGSGGKKKPEAQAVEKPRKPAKRPARRSGGSAPSVGGVAGAAGNKKPPPPPKADKPEKAPAKQIAPALQDAADRLSDGKELTDDDTQALIRNGLARLNKEGELILTAAGMRATQKSKEDTHGLETGTRRPPAQRTGVRSVVRKAIRARHDRPQSADADRQAGRATGQRSAGKAAPAHTGVMVALYPDPAAAKQLASQDGVTEPIDRLHLTLAFLGDSTETALATNKAKLVAAIKQWAAQKGQPLKGTINGLGRFFHAEDDETNAVFVSPDVPGLPELRQSLVEWIKQSGFDYAQNHGFTPHITVAYVPIDAPTPPIRVETPVAFKQVTLAWGDEQYSYPLGAATTKAFSFRVFKDASGRHRWVAQSSTAYQDRDREIVSTKALADDCQFADRTGSYGPLRWWHTPGLDLGDCDFNAMHGRVLIESGTFRSAAIAQKVARAAADLEISLGFLHLPTEPDADGVFHHIRRFERSLVPRGKASNRFTAFTVKELPRMDATKRNYLKTELKFSDAEIAEIEATATATEKAAADQGVAYKAEEPERQEITIAGVTYQLVEKAFPPKAADDGGDVVDEAVVETDAIDDMPIDEPEDDPNALTLSAGDLAAITEAIQGAVATIMGGLDLEKKVASHVQGFLQPLAQAQTTKDAALAEATQQLAQLQQQVKELTGDQAAIQPYRASQANDTAINQQLLGAVKNVGDNDPWADIKKGLGLPIA